MTNQRLIAQGEGERALALLEQARTRLPASNDDQEQALKARIVNAIAALLGEY